ncbi:polysaccharide deacetylase family protein [Halovivax gelatinilyticus]|uniref:polysaccharide deacetylase family protein n=1 Tax=Halovivax gelatinilyticus TaxID=2961597 RepID=UPI0020CA555C|nr:polysaccharide deacetylase family protein [Halovivax gelatinilyticus]
MGTVIISLDSELAWGFHDQKDLPQQRIDNARDAWSRIVDLFESYDIPATWAVVGHLFLDECDGEHLDHPTPDGWFDRDPSGTINDNPDWFGTDLVAKLLESDVEHEIGSHSFSHVEFGSERTTREIAAGELSASRDAMARWDCRPSSFVYPRNNVGYVDMLQEFGFFCYRGTQPPNSEGGLLPLPLQRLLRLGFGRTAPPIVTPKVTADGVVNIPASFYLYTFENEQGAVSKRVIQALSQLAFRFLPYNPHLRQVRLGLEEVASKPNSVFHIWLHPNNVISDEDANRLETVLEQIDMYREERDVAVKTMGEIAAEELACHE